MLLRGMLLRGMLLIKAKGGHLMKHSTSMGHDGILVFFLLFSFGQPRLLCCTCTSIRHRMFRESHRRSFG